MFTNYLKIAWRNLVKNKTFSFINIFGLAIGLACCMMIVAYIADEMSYDKYPEKADQIYRVQLHLNDNGTVSDFSTVDVAVGEGIKNTYPEVLATTRVVQRGNVFMQYKENQFKEKTVAYIDSNFLQLFSIPLSEGSQANALKEPNSVVITKEYALKYFGTEPAMGKLISIGDVSNTFKVTGIIEKFPEHSHFHFDVLTSMPDFSKSQTWSNIGYYTYILLEKGTEAKKLEAKFPDLVASHVVPEIQKDMGVSLAEASKSVNTFIFQLRPLTSIHLHSANKDELLPNGDIRYIYIFSVLAAFILLLACINFINLSTAGAFKRGKETGIRKVMGSLKSQLIRQYLTESVLVTLFAMLLAVGIVSFLIPYFNEIAGKQFAIQSFITPQVVAGLVITCVLVGVLAGIYPAFFLSSFQPIKVLKSSLSSQSPRNSPLRSGLVIFQFTIASAMIIATIVVYQQLQFMQQKKLGFDKDQVLIINDSYTLGNNEAAFRQQLLQDNRIMGASISAAAPIGATRMDGTQIYAKRNATNENHSEIHANIFYIDDHYVPTLGIKINQGRNFSPAYPSDSSAVIINESAVRELGLNKSNAIGATIVKSGQKQFTIIGVTEDFHYASASQKIAPLMLRLGWNSGAIIVKVKSKDITGLMADLKTNWDSYKLTAAFSYSFLDEKFASLYVTEQRTGKLFTICTIISVLIACMGLFGIAAITIVQRTKELGVRKILGASVRQITVLVAKQFLYMVCIAFVIAVPLTWLTMNKWLEDFAYRINISPWIFIIAGATSLLIAIVTVSVQAIKASVANPIKSLRTE